MVVRARVAKCCSLYPTDSPSIKFQSIKVAEFCSLVWSSLGRAHSCSQPLLPAAHYPLQLWFHASPCDSLISWNRHISSFTEECSAWRSCSCQHTLTTALDSTTSLQQGSAPELCLNWIWPQKKRGEKRRWEAKFKKPYQHRQLYASVSQHYRIHFPWKLTCICQMAAEEL